MEKNKIVKATVGAHADYINVSRPLPAGTTGAELLNEFNHMIADKVNGIPLMQGDLGAVIDKVNQKLQVLMSMFDGNERGENLVDEVAKLLREYYRQEHAEDLAGRYVATATTIRLNSDVIGRMRSHSMAKRAARALNHYKPNRKGE